VTIVKFATPEDEERLDREGERFTLIEVEGEKGTFGTALANLIRSIEERGGKVYLVEAPTEVKTE
jgi:hypothetical protein